MIIMSSSPSWERKAKEVFHMKLNPDCIRDTLMALEEVSTTAGSHTLSPVLKISRAPQAWRLTAPMSRIPFTTV